LADFRPLVLASTEISRLPSGDRVEASAILIESTEPTLTLSDTTGGSESWSIFADSNKLQFKNITDNVRYAEFTGGGQLQLYESTGTNAAAIISSVTAPRSITLPDATTTLAGLSLTQTFTADQTLLGASTGRKLKFSRTGDVTATAEAYIDANGNFSVGSTSNNAVIILANNTEYLRILGTGKLGIGTASPAFPVEIKVSNSDTAFGQTTGQYVLGITNSNGTNNTWAQLVFDDGSGNPSALIGAQFTNTSNDNGDLVFGTRGGASATEKMRITSIGNVGIGTTPTQMLHVVSTSVNGACAITQSTNAAPTIKLIQNTASNVIDGNQAGDGTGFFFRNTGVTPTNTLMVLRNSDATTPANIVFEGTQAANVTGFSFLKTANGSGDVMVATNNGTGAAISVKGSAPWYDILETTTAIATPAADTVRLYATVNGVLTELRARFQDGTDVLIAAEV